MRSGIYTPALATRRLSCGTDIRADMQAKKACKGGGTGQTQADPA